MGKKTSKESESSTSKIITAVIIALLVGSSAPWWWNAIFPKKTVSPDSSGCPSETLRTQLLTAGSDSPAIIKIAARTMSEKFRLEDFTCVENISSVLLQFDQKSGHGLYYAGEVWRIKTATEPPPATYSRDRMREHFFRYLKYQQGFAGNRRTGDAVAHAEQDKGYFAERTAWIEYIMAIDYYKWGQETTDKGVKAERFRRALAYINKSLQYYNFDQIIPSSVLQHKIQDELRSLSATDTSAGTSEAAS